PLVDHPPALGPALARPGPAQVDSWHPLREEALHCDEPLRRREGGGEEHREGEEEEEEEEEEETSACEALPLPGHHIYEQGVPTLSPASSARAGARAGAPLLDGAGPKKSHDRARRNDGGGRASSEEARRRDAGGGPRSPPGPPGARESAAPGRPGVQRRAPPRACRPPALRQRRRHAWELRGAWACAPGLGRAGSAIGPGLPPKGAAAAPWRFEEVPAPGGEV
ncbi:unnamed protein product, partial [Prorocentrum cordatum]